MAAAHDLADGLLASSLVHLDDDLRVLETWIEGRPAANGSWSKDLAESLHWGR